MMFRFTHEDGKPPEVKPFLTYGIIALCMIIFLAEAYGSMTYGKDWTGQMFNFFGFSQAGLLSGEWWTTITSLFVHATPDHLILNMIALFFFGHIVEQGLGKKRFLLIFFASGLAGEAAILLASYLGIMPAAIPTVGASAAIFGLMAAAVLVKPFEIIVYPYLIPLPVVIVAIVYAVYNVIAFLTVLGTGAATDVAYASHFGGLAMGALLGFRFEGAKRGLTVLAVVIAILIVIPLLWDAVQSLQVFSYLSVFSGPK
jgi:hypothetical protein